MNIKIYAILDENDVCISIVEMTEDEIDYFSKKYVEIEKHDVFLLNKRYKDGSWEEVDPMYFHQPLSDEDSALLQMQSDLEYLVCLKELGLERR